MIRHHVVGRVELEATFSRNATSDRRFARTASATNPVGVPELLLKSLSAGKQIVSLSFHSSTYQSK